MLQRNWGEKLGGKRQEIRDLNRTMVTRCVRTPPLFTDKERLRIQRSWRGEGGAGDTPRPSPPSERIEPTKSKHSWQRRSVFLSCGFRDGLFEPFLAQHRESLAVYFRRTPPLPDIQGGLGGGGGSSFTIRLYRPMDRRAGPLVGGCGQQ